MASMIKTSEVRMAKNTYMEKGYRVDIGKTPEAKVSNLIDYISVAVGFTALFSYFFFDDWLLMILIILIFLTSLKSAFITHLCNMALAEERAVTNEEFSRMHEEIENIKEKLFSK